MKQNLLSLLIIPVIFIAACASSKHSNRNAKANDSLNDIKVMTYNVHHCNPPSKEKTGEIDLDAIANVIKKQNPDLVALQEIDDHTKRSGNFNEAEEIAKKLDMYFYFGKAMDFDGGGYGIAILSKYPISDTTTFHLPVSEGWKGEPRVLATANVALPNGKNIVFASTHLEAYNKTNRELQINQISRIAASEPLPFVVGGDFNSKPESNIITTLDSMFTRTCVTGCPPTFDEDNYQGVIDYIAFRPNDKFKVISHNVIEEKYASDHFPVVAVLKMN